MWVSINPGQTRHPRASYVSPCAESVRSMATMRPASAPISKVPSATRSESRALRRVSCTCALLDLDVGGLDQWPPFLDFGLVKSAKRRRGLLLGRGDLLAQLKEPLTHESV